MTTRMVSRDCSVCGSARKNVLYDADLPPDPVAPGVVHAAHEGTGVGRWWRYRLVRCVDCGHCYADPVLDPSAVGDSYLAQEHDNHFGVDETILLRTHRGYVDLVKPYLPSKLGLQVDVGCDTGCFLRASRELGFARAVGIEPGKEAAACAATVPGVKVLNKLFDPSDFGPGSVQLLSMIHVLDHLAEPMAFMRGIAPIMDGGGVVFVVVHNIESLLARVSGKHWAPISAIHFDCYAPGSLRRLLEGAGFDVLGIVGTWNYFPLFHLIGCAPGLPWGLRRAMCRLTSGPFMRRWILKLPLGNIAAIARARKG